MTVVNPKSISGITSITTASGSDNLLTIHTSDASSTERVRINSSGDVIVGSGITVSPDGDIFATGITTMNQIKITTGANAFETSANVFKGASGEKGVYLRSALSAEDTPSYSSVDDTNTGIFLPGSDVFGVTTGGSERLRITSGGVIQCGTSGTLKAEINNSVSGHQFISQCDDNNNGFEIYQQHGSTATRNTLAVYDNRGNSGAKQLAFAVRGDGLTVHQGAICMNSETSTANQLDDYEEGTFTPVVANAGVGGNTASSYEQQLGWYTKIGNLVNIQIRLRNIVEGGSISGSDTIYIRGFPFAMEAATGRIVVGHTNVANFNVPSNCFGLSTLTNNGSQNATWCRLFASVDNADHSDQLFDSIGSTNQIQINLTYRTT